MRRSIAIEHHEVPYTVHRKLFTASNNAKTYTWNHMAPKGFSRSMLNNIDPLSPAKIWVEKFRQWKLPNYIDVSFNDESVRFHIETSMEHQHYHNISERDVIKKTLAQLSSDSVFWDVGSAMGLYSCIIAKHYPAATIISFEPHPGRYLRILENANRNKIENIYTYNTSLSDTSEKFKLDIHYRDPNISRMLSGLGGKITAKRTKVSSMLESVVPNPTAMKIDVEGEEYRVLSGLGDRLSTIEFLVVEMHPNQLDVATEEVHDLLKENDFSIEKISERGNQYHILAEK